MSKSKESAVSKDILDYLLRTNRPYSVVDVFNNLHKEHGKTAVTRTLEDLATAGKIIEKVNGKQKIYFVNQDLLPKANDEEMKQMDVDITEMSNKLKAITSQVKAKEAQLSSLNSSKSISEIELEILKTQRDICELKKKFESLGTAMKNIDPGESEKIKEEHTKCVGEWKKRKRMATFILDAILEGYPKSKKALLEEIGIETDEDYKVTLPTV